MAPERRQDQAALSIPTLHDGAFAQFREIIYRQSGINITGAKRVMLAGRLLKRIKALGLDGYDAYLAYLRQEDVGPRELVELIDVVTTNKTDFFREADHYAYLMEHHVPQWHKRQGANEIFRIWSAGCASGEEPYTLAILLDQARAAGQGPAFSVTATDISSRMLALAAGGVYEDSRLAPVPRPLVRRYFMRGTGRRRGYHRLVPEIRRLVRFQRVNLLDRDFDLGRPFDAIFCRNVMIYFDQKTRRAVLERLHRWLVPGGILCVGHSETMLNVQQLFERQAPAVYRRQ